MSLPSYTREVDGVMEDGPKIHLICWSCRHGWLSTGPTSCPRCDRPTVTVNKRGTKPDRRRTDTEDTER